MALRALFAVAAGVGLSFLGLGVLWAGAPWRYQALMLLPFLFATFVVTRTGVSGDKTWLLVIYGAAPLAALLTMFRDRDDSHLMPILMVCFWALGALGGHVLASRALKGRAAG
jgi:hypothetical protein